MPIYNEEVLKRTKLPFIARIVPLLIMLAITGLTGQAFLQGSQIDPEERKALETRGAIIRVTAGTEPLILGNHWQKLMARANPVLAELCGGAVLRSKWAQPGDLVVWQHWGRATTMFGPAAMLTVKLSDGSGNQMEEIVRCSDYLQAHDEMVFPFVVTNYPRGGEHVRIQVDGMPGLEVGESFTVPNPRAGSHL